MLVESDPGTGLILGPPRAGRFVIRAPRRATTRGQPTPADPENAIPADREVVSTYPRDRRKTATAFLLKLNAATSPNRSRLNLAAAKFP